MGWSEWKNFGESMDLIWENPNPTTIVNSLVATCDYEKYPYLVVSIGSINGKARNTQILKTNIDTRLQNSGLNYDYDRTITYGSGKITFTTGLPQASGGNYTLPQRIYGVTDLESLPYIY